MDKLAQLNEGLTLMCLGMGVVFSLLLLLIFVIKLMSYALLHLEKSLKKTTLPLDEKTEESPLLEQSDPTLIAIISTAIHKHRQIKASNINYTVDSLKH